MPPLKLIFAFDIGHSSIGWSLLNLAKKSAPIVGTGTVFFKADDCLAIQRASFRRQRRNIAARRNRIRRLGMLFDALNLPHDSSAKLYSYPWLLAASSLKGLKKLNSEELYEVLVWYAHNRGYDGNALWANEISEDSEREKLAVELMRAHQTRSMAETVCAVLGVTPGEKKKSSMVWFKGKNAAFPRSVVINEVREILENNKHVGYDDSFIACLIEDWKRFQIEGVRLPKRFFGGYLFGQMKPRFENRIIPICRISGGKTPLKNCKEFYYYRWGMLLCNIRVKDPIVGVRSLTPKERRSLTSIAESKGIYTKTSLNKALGELDLEEANLQNMFLTPDMEKALMLDPVKKLLDSDSILSDIWGFFPDKYQKIFRGMLYKGRKCSLGIWLEKLKEGNVGCSELDSRLEQLFEKTKRKKRKEELSYEAFLAQPIKASTPSGRAPYSRELMALAWKQVIGLEESNIFFDPKASGGCLEENEKVRIQNLSIPIDSVSNNHLVRHRLLIFERLVGDLIDEFANGDVTNIDKVIVEVIRDLQEFSSKTAKEKAQLIGLQQAHHKKIVKLLEKSREERGSDFEITASLIKKARIADDQNWKCPFTGKDFSVNELVSGQMEREHIIPRSLRESDSMSSLVMTFREVNAMKGNRCARAFIAENEGRSIPGMPNLELFTLNQYDTFVRKLKPGKDPRTNDNLVYKGDQQRCWSRKQLLMIDHFDKRKDGGFVGKDLSQSSYITKLAAQKVNKLLVDRGVGLNESLSRVITIPGTITSAVRKSWDTLHCLSLACPESVGKTKTDIRSMTHLHHSLDACMMGLAYLKFSRGVLDGKLQAILGKRRLSNEETDYLRANYSCEIQLGENQFRLRDLEKNIKQNISSELARKRVVMHQPKSMQGLSVEQNMRRVLGYDDTAGKVVLEQRSRGENGLLERKKTKEKPFKVHGFKPKNGTGKLQDLKAVFVIEENFGLALTTPPRVIAYSQVWSQLNEIPKGTSVLRNGDVIEVAGGQHKGIWRIRSIKDTVRGIWIDVGGVDRIDQIKTITLSALLKAGVTKIEQSYSGKSKN